MNRRNNNQRVYPDPEYTRRRVLMHQQELQAQQERNRRRNLMHHQRNRLLRAQEESNRNVNIDYVTVSL
jgi:hypothetical protein